MGFSTSSRKVYLDLMVFHVFCKFRRNSDLFEKSSGEIFWVRQFVDVSGGMLLVRCSIDSIYFLICF